MRRHVFLALAIAGCGGAGGDPDAGMTTTDAGAIASTIPRAVQVARATSIPACTLFVDAASTGTPDGTAALPYRAIAEAVAAASDGAVICVAEGAYAEALLPGDRAFTLAGGFQSGQGFTVRDSSRYVTRAEGDGTNTFLRIEGDVAPGEGELTAIDGFEITGYSQAIVRDTYFGQRFDITNNFIHDNTCTSTALVGGGFVLVNVSGTVSGNVLARNTCGRGGAGAVLDSLSTSAVTIANNLVESNEGNEESSHGGGLYLLANELTVIGNAFVSNRVAAWGGGLYVGADPPRGLDVTARMSWNVYRNNAAQVFGGGFFCDDGARCESEHEIYGENCAGNIFLDSGTDETTPTVASFDHLTSYAGLTVGCDAPGAGVIINKENAAPDAYTFTNAIFAGNEADHDFDASCAAGCSNITVNVAFSVVSTRYANGGVTIAFGEGNLDGVDPRFADAEAGDFHLRSTNGHFTPSGYVEDAEDSPALASGDPSAPAGDNPDRAGERVEMGAYGNSDEASYVR
jgi:hypothetical protein